MSAEEYVPRDEIMAYANDEERKRVMATLAAASRRIRSEVDTVHIAEEYGRNRAIDVLTLMAVDIAAGMVKRDTQT